MANEIKLSIGLKLTQSSQTRLNWVVDEAANSMVGTRHLEEIISVGTVNTLIPVAALTGGTLGLAMFQNLTTGTSNKMSLVTSASGSKFAELGFGEYAVFKFGSDVTAPYVVGTVAGDSMRIVILEY